MTAHALPTRRDPRLWSAEQFHVFLETRPEDERWQLVDGLAMMMAPPTRWHQKISKNLLLLLDRALESNRPDLEVYFELGARIEGIDDFSPQPDLLVIRRSETFERYVPRFLLVAEVISPSNTAEMIERKLDIYRGHSENLYCLTIDQDMVHVTLFAREDEWRRVDLCHLDDLLEIPAFGFSAPLREVYRDTPLAP